MKRTIAILLIAIMLMASITVYADNGIIDGITNLFDNTVEIIKLQIKSVETVIDMISELVPKMLAAFKDVKESDWFKDNLALLYGLGVTEGDGQGNFAPNKELTGSEYLKMVVVALDNQQYKVQDGSDWDKPYIERAKALGLVKEEEINNFRKPLNRYNMARIIVRACKEEYGNYNQYESYIKDYKNIPSEFKEYVLKAYSKGLINGYTDGTFGGEKTMRRSEATAVIARLVDPSQRVTPIKPGEPKIDNDLVNVPITSDVNLNIKDLSDNPNNYDFDVLVRMYKPLEPQYKDVENLLRYRFGKDNKTVTEIMNYIKLKDIEEKELPDKEWIITGKTIKVGSGINSRTVCIQVWRVIK